MANIRSAIIFVPVVCLLVLFQNCNGIKASDAVASVDSESNGGLGPPSNSPSSESGISPIPATVAQKYAGRWPAIFYIPHQDDEALGFAGAAVEHKMAGRPVFYVLISSGNDDHLHSTFNGHKDCFINQSWMAAVWNLFPSFGFPAPWKNHPVSHGFNLTMSDVIRSRNAEFLASAAQVGVDEVFFVANGKGIDDSEFYSDYNGSVDKVRKIIEEMHLQFPNASHKFPSGLVDYMFDGTTWMRNQTHMAINQAALDVRTQLGLDDLKFYRIYAYWDPAGNFAQHPWSSTQKIEPPWMVGKRRALDEYKRWDPQMNRFAMGYHSVPTLIDRAYTDEWHYLDEQ